MYAVIETGGKQYRVELGSELAVERLDAAPGATIDFDRVLLVADGDEAQVGTPTVAEAMVTADVVRQDRGNKIIVFKYRPKARHRSKKGHRQEQTVIRVADIRFNGRSAADEEGAQRAEETRAREQAEADAARKAAADQALAAKLAAGEEANAAKDTPSAADGPARAKPARKRTAAATSTAKAEATDEASAAETSAAETAEATETADQPKTTTRSRATRSSSTKKDE